MISSDFKVVLFLIRILHESSEDNNISDDRSWFRLFHDFIDQKKKSLGLEWAINEQEDRCHILLAWEINHGPK